jgi:tryptophan 2,3-dioxygenase
VRGYLDFDQLLQSWRQRHLLLVYRIIGAGTPSLKGKPSELLEQGMKHRFFPALWEVRDEVLPSGRAPCSRKGKETGYHG